MKKAKKKTREAIISASHDLAFMMVASSLRRIIHASSLSSPLCIGNIASQMVGFISAFESNLSAFIKD